MSYEKILNQSSILAHYEILVDDQRIIQDDIMFLKLSQNIDQFGISGSFRMKDTFDINNNSYFDLNGDNLITVKMVDISGNRSNRTFRIIDIKIDTANERFKMYEFFLIDEITFRLSNTYISKSFNATTVEAFKTYFDELKIDDLALQDKLVVDFEDGGDTQTFVVPQNMSVLDFFIDKFKESNLRMYQTRSGFFIKEVIPSKIPPLQDNNIDVLFTNKTDNNLYLFKVHDYQERKNSISVSSYKEPIKKIFRFNVDKTITTTTRNLFDIADSLKLNDKQVNTIQHTIGEQHSVQSVFTTKNQDFDLSETFSRTNQVEIAVPGNLHTGNIGSVVKLSLKGSIVTPETTHAGDVQSSGYYFIADVSDSVIVDKLIQKLTLCRVDAQKGRNVL